ncbi:MAG: gamma-glutamyltransferase [Parvularculales bacterium]
MKNFFLSFFWVVFFAIGPVAHADVPAAEGMVVAANPHATKAGVEILERGGSAVDAAIAVQAVLGLVEPQSSGIGGGAFLLTYDAASGTVRAYDGRETAPVAVDETLFLNPDGTPMGFWEAIVGGRAVGVPGLVALLYEAHRREGNLTWAELFQPAIELANRGFRISPRLAFLIGRDKYLPTFPRTREYFYLPDGTPKPVGTILKNPDYAQSLQAIADQGPDAFYRGPLAQEIVSTVRNTPQNPGQLSLEDMAAYKARMRPPLCLPYKTFKICGMPPPSSGGLAVLQILGLLAPFKLESVEPLSVQSVHLIAEAGRLAFADRNYYVGDPDFVDVPLDALLDEKYLDGRSTLISPTRAMGKAKPGLIIPDLSAPPPQFEPPSTTHFSIIDKKGNAVSMTSSVENAFGSRLMAGGFILNNQISDFSFVPAVEGRPVANRVEAGKRPRSSMAPTLVLDDTGAFYGAIGSPGGSRIIGYTANALVAMLDWNLPPQEAVSLPHFLNRNGPTELEKDIRLAGLIPALEALGHEIKQPVMNSGLHGILKTGQGLEGGADPRREGTVMITSGG